MVTLHQFCLFKGTLLRSSTFNLKRMKCSKFLSEIPSSYGGRRIISMLPGCGNGPALMKNVRDVFRLASIPVDFEVIDKCDGNIEILSVMRNGLAIKGKV